MAKELGDSVKVSQGDNGEVKAFGYAHESFEFSIGTSYFVPGFLHVLGDVGDLGSTSVGVEAVGPLDAIDPRLKVFLEGLLGESRCHDG